MILLFMYVHLGILVSSVLLYKTIEVSVTTSTGSHLSTGIPVQEGVSLQHSELLPQLQPYGFIQCIRKCLLHQSCVGLVHEGITCRLGKHLDGFQSSGTPSSTVYVDKATITDGLKQILTTECYTATCNVGHVCQPLSSGHLCVATECTAFPFNVTNTFVNLTVGATNNLSCADNYTQFGSSVQTCHTDGQWTPGDLLCAPFCDISVGYAFYPEGCFRAVRSRSSPTEALAACQQDGASLARIDSQAKYDAMATEVGTGGLFYLEGFDANMDENWLFDDGTPMTYTNWYTSSYTPGSCIAYYPGNGITRMDCAVDHYFLCEMR